MIFGLPLAFVARRCRDLRGSFDGFCFFDPDRFQPNRGQFQRVSLSRRIVTPPHVRTWLRLDLLDKSRGNQLCRELLGSRSLQIRRSGDAAALALSGRAKRQELRVSLMDMV
jgi:hypothetical protein